MSVGRAGMSLPTEEGSGVGFGREMRVSEAYDAGKVPVACRISPGRLAKPSEMPSEAISCGGMAPVKSVGFSKGMSVGCAGMSMPNKEGSGVGFGLEMGVSDAYDAGRVSVVCRMPGRLAKPSEAASEAINSGGMTRLESAGISKDMPVGFAGISIPFPAGFSVVADVAGCSVLVGASEGSLASGSRFLESTSSNLDAEVSGSNDSLPFSPAKADPVNRSVTPMNTNSTFFIQNLHIVKVLTCTGNPHRRRLPSVETEVIKCVLPLR